MPAIAPPLTIYMVRHGQTEWNLQGRWQGHTDIPLNDTGYAQATALAQRMLSLGVTRVSSSDLSRAHQTAAVIAAHLGVPHEDRDPGFRERNFGVFEGQTREDCEAKHPELWQAYQADRRIMPPGAERHDLVVQRMDAALNRFAQTLLSHGHNSDRAQVGLAVAHGGCMRLLIGAATGNEVPPLGNTAVYRLHWQGGKITDAQYVDPDTSQ